MLLLDEPLGALDLKLRKNLQVELKRIQQDIGITFVYVTHDQEEALTMSDRIAVMNKGIVEQVAGPEEVYERPATTFVAGFIGVSNLMPGTVRSLSGDTATVELDAGVTVESGRNGMSTGEQCHAVVRPEKLVVSAADNGGGAGMPDGAQSVAGRRRQLDLPRHRDPARRRAQGRIADDRPRSQRRRARPPGPARSRGGRQPRVDAGTHPPRARVGNRARDRKTTRRSAGRARRQRIETGNDADSAPDRARSSA